MDKKALELMQRLLRPVSPERIAEVVRMRTKPGSFEQLTLADAGLEDEVRELLRRDKERK